MTTLEMFKNFINDEKAFDMYVTGPAGTGKTTQLGEVVKFCLDEGIPTVVCAYTHKAAKILKSKLPENADVRTLHSFLRKRPGINEHACNIKQIATTTQFGIPQKISLLIVDEYSMVGESDAMSIGELQDPDYDGIPDMKVIYVGDPYQLPPVGDIQTIQPVGEYSQYLTHIYRQDGNDGLLKPLSILRDMLEGGKTTKLPETDMLKRKVDILKEYEKSTSKDKIILAYTNKAVENLNKTLYEIYPVSQRWSPTLREEMSVPEDTIHVTNITTPGFQTMQLNTKFKTLEHLIRIADDYNIKFGDVNIGDEEHTIAYVFGHYQFKLLLEKLRFLAAESNDAIHAIYKGSPGYQSPAKWAKANPHEELARKRAKAWRDFLTINECVVCLDYPYATTVHKSQGSTYEEVFIDSKDLSQVAQKDGVMYLKLMYVAVSRASNKVFMNT